jgi:tetratricopeptide (TPR) repeat protein
MKFVVIISITIFAFGCGNNAAPVQNTNTASQPQRAEKLQSTTVHTTEGQATPPVANEDAAAAADSAKGGKFSAGGNPIDTTELDKAVAEAEKRLKANPKDAVSKAGAVEAYFKRGFALTDARQYAAALGDYRKALKLDPAHEESLKWQKQIIGIYEMMKKEYPKPGEEPSPLPWKAEK